MVTAVRKSSVQKAAKKVSAKKPSTAQHCWPGFEPVPGKAAGEKGSCKPKAGGQTKAVRKADQKAAAASKLQKTNPRSMDRGDGAGVGKDKRRLPAGMTERTASAKADSVQELFLGL